MRVSQLWTFCGVMCALSMVGCSDADDAAEAPVTIDGVEPLSDEVALPMLFVHGFAGSAQQIQSQAMRYEANGYPVGRIRAYEHHGGLNGEDFTIGLSAMVDAMLDEFGVEQIYLMGHSRGTFVSATYLGDADNAAKIAKYISLDGVGCAAADMAGVPCIAPDQAMLPGQAHVEVAISEESFEMQYEFFIGEPPAVTAIVPQEDPVVISGRAVNFPENTGRAGVTLEVWPVDADTGHRVGDTPLETYTLDDEGAFGPLTVDPETYYEMVLISDDGQHHHYNQLFQRSTPFVRLLSGTPESDTAVHTHTSPDHAAVIAMRMREWKTSDVLEIETTGAGAGDEGPVNVIVDGVGVDGGFGNLGIHIHDAEASPGDSTLEPLPWFPDQSFQTGLDVFMPSDEDARGTITFTNQFLGDADAAQVLRTPNWPSETHRITVMFSDYAQ